MSQKSLSIKTGQALKNGFKICSHCKKLKEISLFRNRIESLDGKHSWCNDCMAEAQRIRNKTVEYKKYNNEIRKTKKYRERINRYSRKRYKEIDSLIPQKRLDANFRSLIRQSLISGKRGKSWESIVNYTIEDLVNHLEKQFDDKMSWENYGRYWSIDHIIPRSYFNYKDYNDIEFKICWSLLNIRPLEKIENIIKRDRVDYEFLSILKKSYINKSYDKLERNLV